MASLGLALKREAATQGYTALFRSIAGSDPGVVRGSNGVNIILSDSQARQVEDYLGAKVPFNFFYLHKKRQNKKEEASGESLNVNVNWGKVLIPLAIKTAVPPLILYTALTFYLSKKV